MRWYLRFGLSYRDLEKLLAERGIEVDHVTLHHGSSSSHPSWSTQRRRYRHAVGGRWFVDESYVRVAGRSRYLYRAIDENGQVIDLLVSTKRDATTARRFFAAAIDTHGSK